MLEWILALALGLGAFTSLFQETPPASNPPTDARLDALLRAWEKNARATKDFRFEFERTIDDPIFRTKKVVCGVAAGAKPKLLRIDSRDEKKTPLEIVLYTGKMIQWYEFESRRKNVFSWDDVEGKKLGRFGRVIKTPLDDFHSLFFGMALSEVKTRFQLRLVKEYGHYAYVDLTPRNHQDRPSNWIEGLFIRGFRDCVRIQVALDNKTYVIRSVRFIESNGNTVTWLFNHLETDVSPAISVESLSENLPKNWTQVVW